jgi:hypothetical protein
MEGCTILDALRPQNAFLREANAQRMAIMECVEVIFELAGRPTSSVPVSARLLIILFSTLLV